MSKMTQILAWTVDCSEKQLTDQNNRLVMNNSRLYLAEDLTIICLTQTIDCLRLTDYVEQ